MEVGTEISQKIRSAIKAKLLELGSYVDDELPDYIMVMVANKKTRAQMNSDLGLFLGVSTEAFTEWLHSLLAKLQTIKVDSDKKCEKSKSSNDARKDKYKRGDSIEINDNKDKEKKKKVKYGSENVTKSGSTSRSETRKSQGREETQDRSSQVCEAERRVSEDHKSHEKTQQISQDKKSQNREKTRRIPEDGKSQGSGKERLVSKDRKSREKAQICESETQHIKLPQTSSSQKGLKQNKCANKNRKEADKHPVSSYREQETANENQTSAQDDVEDVRQLLVVDTPRDALAEELETVEEEFVKSRTVTVATKKASPLTSTDARTVGRARLKRSTSPESHEASRKRRAPLSTVTHASKRESDEEEYDPYNPAVGTVASVVKVTARKSSVPPSLQANRALLLKAMTEAEQSIAVKRKVSVKKPAIRNSSSAEAYSPKRIPSDHSQAESSPPPYIPSRKNSSEQLSENSDALQRKESRIVTQDAASALKRDDYSEIISRSRREELLRSIGINRDVSHRMESSKSPAKDKRLQERDTEFTYSREVRGDKSLKGIKNFQITTRVVSSNSGSSISMLRENRKRLHSLSPEARRGTSPQQKMSLNVTINPVHKNDTKTSITARLGKVVVERKDSSEYEDTQDATKRSPDNDESSSWQMEFTEATVTRGKLQQLKDNSEGGKLQSGDNSDRGKLQAKGSSDRLISSSSREAAQEHHKTAESPGQASRLSKQMPASSSPDSRVVQSDDCVDNNREKKDVSSSSQENAGADFMKPPGVSVRAREHNKSIDDMDDLAKMIDEDLGPELLEGTQNDAFNLDLDEDDINHIISEMEAEPVNPREGEELEKSDNKPGTKFIVTLDGVDERQFTSQTSKTASSDKGKPPPPPVAAAPPVATTVKESNPSHLQLNQELLLDLLATQSKNTSQTVLHQLHTPAPATKLASKLAPPKIQPFSINLKDSDDEHDDGKETKASTLALKFLREAAVVAEEENELSALKRAKMTERCKFWPACLAGASCEYHHPTTHCKTFPSCRFGDKCLFIHPNCRFDSRCARPDCPYTHTSQRPGLTSAAHVITIPQSHFIISPTPPRHQYTPKFLGSSPQTMCRYLPHCQNGKCAFMHPKPCKFGSLCKIPGCPFYHHQPQPTRDKLKWQAHHEQQKISHSLQAIKVEPGIKKIRNNSAKSSHSATVSSTSQ